MQYNLGDNLWDNLREVKEFLKNLPDDAYVNLLVDYDCTIEERRIGRVEYDEQENKVYIVDSYC